MKKIISLMLVILMLASSMLMISCFNDDDDDDDDSTKINAKSEIKSAIEKMETVDSYTGTSSLAIDVKSQGITVTLEMNYAIKMADLLTDPKRYADVSITSFGVAETGVIYGILAIVLVLLSIGGIVGFVIYIKKHTKVR